MFEQKLQIACLVIIIFIATLFFSAKRESNRLHKSFAAILICMPIYLLSDISSAYTVNNMLHSTVNDIVHRWFLIMVSVTVYLFCMHMQNLVTNEVGCGKKRRKIIVLIKMILAVSIIYSLFATPSYEIAKYNNYASTEFAFGAFAAVGIYVVIITVSVFYYWNLLPIKKRLAILLAVIIETVGLLLQLFYTQLLLSGFSLSMMTLAFYLTMDNPDIALLEQVSEEKKKVEEMSDSKSAFISVVSHEIRTPMNAIIGMSEILLRDSDSLNEKQENYLRNIKSSGEALVMIANDILDQSKLESGKMELIEDCYDIYDTTNDIRLIIENRIGDKPIELEYDIDEEVPRYLIGDGLRIRQILINLMNNAVKFTEAGFIRLSIKMLRSDEEKCQIRFSISDSGQGIKPADLMKLGQAFTQVDSARNHSKEGTGLGLSISRDFIELMGSQLEVSSEYGKGSDFSFTIWQNHVKDENEASSCDDFTSPDSRVLFVDDSDINLTIDRELVRPLELVVDTANSGVKALDMMKSVYYDMIFVDHMMPGMDGVEVTEKIRGMKEKDWKGEKEYPEGYYKNVPIIALTGDSSEKTIKRFTNAGSNGYIIKPVEIKELRKFLRKWLPKEKIANNNK